MRNSGMESDRRGPGRPESGLGKLMRYWREARGKSQFDLALETGVSQRHISFIESGRSIPSREKLMHLAEGLHVPLRERNGFLLAAGYAPIYPESPLDGPEMESIVNALRRVLYQHEPFPAVVMDRYWNVLMTNDAAPRFFGKFIDMESRPKPRNLLHLMFDPNGMRPFISNWGAVSESLLARIHREAIGQIVDQKTTELIQSLLDYSGGDARNVQEVTALAPALPMIPIGFMRHCRTLSYFSMITTVGTPLTIAAQELRIECMYPADSTTETQHLKLMGRSFGRSRKREQHSTRSNTRLPRATIRT
jgi:transcriptional regulator with XRE-family HTH domain